MFLVFYFPLQRLSLVLNLAPFQISFSTDLIHIVLQLLPIMSVDRELQFLAMLEGHELEKELLDIVSTIIISLLSVF